MSNEIDSEKILVKDIFSGMWFNIPEYQRPYIWGKDQINELLDDLGYAMTNKPDQEYFLGSIVFQKKKASNGNFEENDLLDGQQRMTSLFMLFSVIRDLSKGADVKANCTKAIFQKGDEIDGIPERTRIGFEIREVVQSFVEEYIKKEEGTNNVEKLSDLVEKSASASVKNMAFAILEMRSYLQENYDDVQLKQFLTFLRNKVILIYVSTEDLQDAFRLFTILNDRGVPLRNSDILKSKNLGLLTDNATKARYARMWEEAEGELGEEFDRFLNFVRTILVKDKARLSLLDEFEHKIYEPKEKDKATGLAKPALLAKGEPTFKFIEKYLTVYKTVTSEDNYDEVGRTFEFDNLIKVMVKSLPSTDWVPPLLTYFEKFRYDQLLPFLKKLDNKASSDWVSQYTPTKRIENMNNIIKLVEKASSPDAVLHDDCFNIHSEAFLRNLSENIYGRRFTRYILLKLDFLKHDQSARMNFEHLSVEHILPQNPHSNSKWVKDFTEEEREQWTHKIGNLVLVGMKKNTSLGRLDYAEKKRRYFEKRIANCPHSLNILNNHEVWDLTSLVKNQKTCTESLKRSYCLI